MSGLAIKMAALLLVNVMVQGRSYQEDRYLKDKDHVQRYRVLYSDEDSSDPDDDAAMNIHDWTTIQDRPVFHSEMNAPDWFTRGSLDTNQLGSGRGIGDVPDWFLRNINQGPGQRWPGRDGVPNWISRRPGLEDYDDRSNFGRGLRFPVDNAPPGWFPRLPGDNNDDQEPRNRPGQKQPGDTSVCQNIKGLPTPESGCCGVQLKHFPLNEGADTWWPRRDARFRRSTDGDQKPDQMIIGGKPTKIHQLPWMARIMIDSYVSDFGSPKFCGGSIISSRYILTAGHCVYNTFKELRQLSVFLSEYDTSTFPEDCVDDQCVQNMQMKVDHVIIHPKFNHTHLQNDIALLRLKSDIPYTDFIRPICLPTADIKTLSSEPTVIAGWGKNGVEESHLKRSAFVNYVKDDECLRHYSYKDEGMFCSIGGQGEDICHGDSGGPLMVIHDKRFFLSGVVNGKRSNVECGSSLPSLFNNVFYHLEWIKKKFS